MHPLRAIRHGRTMAAARTLSTPGSSVHGSLLPAMQGTGGKAPDRAAYRICASTFTARATFAPGASRTAMLQRKAWDLLISNFVGH